jgi:hypothetical protein
MTKEDRRLHVAAAIACVSMALQAWGVSQTSEMHGVGRTLTPIAVQVMAGANMPAIIAVRLIAQLPGLLSLVSGFILSFGAILLFWLWVFAWVRHLRRRTMSGVAKWISVAWALGMGGRCLYLSNDMVNLQVFPRVIGSWGLAAAITASGAAQWNLTLLWGLFLTGSAIFAAIREVRVPDYVANEESAGKPAHRPRDRKAHK